MYHYQWSRILPAVCFAIVTLLTFAEPAEFPASSYKSIEVRPIALQAKDQDDKDTGPPNCKKLMLVMAKRMLKVLNGCVKELKVKYPDKESLSEHFQCALKCFMSRVNMIDEKGMMTKESLTAFGENYLPPKYLPLYWKVIGICHKEWETKIDPKDEKCTTYGDVVKCMQEVATTACT